MVSVPIRGLFNLTLPLVDKLYTCDVDEVSVPIRGLFNLTEIEKEKEQKTPTNRFPSPLGDYLI